LRICILFVVFLFIRNIYMVEHYPLKSVDIIVCDVSKPEGVLN
jgi:hypothetical protein